MAISYETVFFFDFWRRRVENARWLRQQERSFDPEIHLVVTTGLDALANHWAATFRPALNASHAPASARLHEFLVLHGDPQVFCKVSAPDLVHRAHKESSPVEPFVRRYLALPYGRVRHWEDDPDVATVLANPTVMAVVASRWVEKSRYAEILYSAYRCGWVHEFNPKPSTSPAYNDERGRPRYQNYLEGVRQRLVLPVDYLIDVFENCITGFETECSTAGTAPIAP
jgi:hypothetical protein